MQKKSELLTLTKFHPSHAYLGKIGLGQILTPPFPFFLNTFGLVWSIWLGSVCELFVDL